MRGQEAMFPKMIIIFSTSYFKFVEFIIIGWSLFNSYCTVVLRFVSNLTLLINTFILLISHLKYRYQLEEGYLSCIWRYTYFHYDLI